MNVDKNDLQIKYRFYEKMILNGLESLVSHNTKVSNKDVDYS